MAFANVNDVVYAVAKRARELGEKSMDELRLECGYGCDTPAEARRVNKHKTRGEMIEEVLTEEFVEEIPKLISDD